MPRCTSKARIRVFNRRGIPIGQLLKPAPFSENHQPCDQARNDEVHIVASGADGGQGTMVLRAQRFAQAHLLYSHR
jgi:hypothetical protein